MNPKFTFTKESLDRLLNWLSSDQDKAAAHFEDIHLRLIRSFNLLGINHADAEILADETMARVADVIMSENPPSNDKPLGVFLRYATLGKKEFLRKQLRSQSEFDLQYFDKHEAFLLEEESSAEARYQCLGHCLDKLSQRDRSLITSYYDIGQGGRFEPRKMLAANYDLTRAQLISEIWRIRQKLEKCVSNCMHTGGPFDSSHRIEGYLVKNLGPDIIWQTLNRKILETLDRSNEVTLSDVFSIAGPNGGIVNKLLILLTVLSSPSGGFLSLEFTDLSTNSEVTVKQFNRHLSQWWRDKRMSDKDWKFWASGVKVRWTPSWEWYSERNRGL